MSCAVFAYGLQREIPLTVICTFTMPPTGTEGHFTVTWVAVVVATHDHDGDLDGLSWQQLDLLTEKHGAVTARDARRLYRATKSRHKALVVTTGFEHGTDLLQDPEAERALLDFLVGG